MLPATVPFILTIDPGTTTGYSWFSPLTGLVTCGQLGPHDHHNELLELIDKLRALSGGRLVVVYETFEFRHDFGEEKTARALQAMIYQLRTKTMNSVAAVIRELERIVNFKSGSDGLVLDSREYIGIVKLSAQQHADVEIVTQSPSEALWFVKDNKIQALGWYASTKGLPHARDALRHLLRYLVVTCKVKEPIVTAWFRGEPDTPVAVSS
jgi:hypothetical protein